MLVKRDQIWWVMKSDGRKKKDAIVQRTPGLPKHYMYGYYVIQPQILASGWQTTRSCDDFVHRLSYPLRLSSIAHAGLSLLPDTPGQTVLLGLSTRRVSYPACLTI